MTILDQIIEAKRERLIVQKQERPLSELQQIAEKQEIGRFHQSLSTASPAVIAEVKRHSPSKGPLRPDLNPIDLAGEYASSGARAISVLTEEDYFHGSIDDLLAVRESVDLPVLRKDFMIDEYQIWEAASIGASCILLIAAALSQSEMRDYYALASELGLDTLFEVHNKKELETVMSLQPRLLGVNNRNLKDFTVDLNISLDLIEEYRGQLLPETIWISESGIYERADIESLKNAGYQGFLIGESLLKSDAPAKKLKELLG